MKGKGCLIAVIIVVVILVAAVLILYLNRGKLVNMAMDKMVEAVMTSLPEDYDRERAQQTFDEFIVAVKKNRVEKEEFQEIGEIMQAIMADQKLETQEVDQLMEVLQEASQ
jgi:uncharacterized protein YpuA (DUF1002 family)